MSRQPELEAILQARYDLETCEPSEKTKRRARLEALMDAALRKAGTKGVSHRDLIQILAEAYQEFKRAKKHEERAKLSRIR
jgi:alpha-D-ribose 1-methylphosphonate 5-triphosphate synthase subunit PhnG